MDPEPFGDASGFGAFRIPTIIPFHDQGAVLLLMCIEAFDEA
jgi:hypothetical protein